VYWPVYRSGVETVPIALNPPYGEYVYAATRPPEASSNAVVEPIWSWTNQ